jgi:predicted GIY-YIG superfamily endonuclease
MGAYLYILRCADGSYYVGTTTAGLERRLAEHQAGDFDGYTAELRSAAISDIIMAVSDNSKASNDGSRLACKTDEEWRRRRFEAGRIFTPSTPIGIAELLSGRQPQIGKLVDTVAERGRHALVYGEPGVGKTSLAQIIQYLIPFDRARVKYIKKSAFSSDNYSSIWMSIFKELNFLPM